MRRVGPNVLIVSRRNLYALLAQLDGHTPHQAPALLGGGEAPGFILLAEEDEVHYADRPFGVMSAITEAAIRDVQGRPPNEPDNVART